MEAKMIITNGDSAGTEIPLRAPKFFIGHAQDCQFRPHNDSVSRHHCVVLVEDDFLAVRDLGSKPGTLVNGKRIAGERELEDGDRIRLGELELEVRTRVRTGPQQGEPAAQQEASAGATESIQKEDLDLDTWLSQPDLPGPAGTEPNEGETAASPAEQKQPEASEEKRKQTEEKPVDVVGVWKKGHWKPTSVDPSHAAADTLKNFFKRH